MIFDGTTGTNVFTPLRGVGSRSKNVAAQLEKVAVHDFGVKNLIPFLEPAYGCHVRKHYKRHYAGTRLNDEEIAA